MMTDVKIPRVVTLIPPDDLPPSPYSNITYTYRVNEADVTIVFLRSPLLSEEKAKAFLESGATELRGDFIGSITLAPKAALDLAEQLKRMLAL